MARSSSMTLPKLSGYAMGTVGNQLSSLPPLHEQFLATGDAMTLLAERTAHTDQLVAEAADKLLFPSAGSGLALLAVGGYGRRQLFPYSDIDLLLLFENERLMGACKDAISIFLR